MYQVLKRDGVTVDFEITKIIYSIEINHTEKGKPTE